MSIIRPYLKIIPGLLFSLVCTGYFLPYLVYSQQSQGLENDNLVRGGPELINTDMGGVRAFHQVGDTLLISGENGLYQWNSKLEGKPEPVYRPVGRIFASHRAGNTLLVGAAGGMFRWNDKLEDRPGLVKVDLGAIRGFYQAGDVLLIGTEKGLYRWNDKLEGKPELVDAAIRDANRFDQMGNALLIRGAGGLLCRWNDKLEGRPEFVDTEMGVIRKVDQIGSTLLLGTARGLYRWNNKLIGVPEALNFEMGGILALQRVDSALLISAEKGLYKWTDKLEGKPEPVSTDMGDVLAFYLTDSTALLGATGGLYRWGNRLEGKPQLVDASLDGISTFHQVGDALLISAGRGLYRWNNKLEGRPILVDESIGVVYFFNQMGSTLLISTEGGSYKWNDKLDDKPRLVDVDMGPIRGFHQLGDILLIGADGGLYKWNDKLEGNPEFIDAWMGGISNLHQVGDALLIGTSGGLLQWNDDLKGGPQIISSEMGHVLSFYQTDDILWIGAEKGLYQWNSRLVGRPRRLDTAVGDIFALREVDNSLMVGSRGGLYRWNNKLEGKPELIDAEMGTVLALHQVGSTLLIGAQSGLLKVQGVGTKWNADITVIPLPSRILPETGVTVKWVIKNYEGRANPRNVRVRLIVKDQSGAIVSMDSSGNKITQEQWTVPQGQHQFTTPNLKPGSYSLTVQATDLTGNTSESETVAFRVYSSLEEYLLDWGKFLTILYIVGTVVLFLVLVLGARRSRKCFDILTDPLMRKLGIYFGFALRYIMPVRTWVFERYFDELKKDWSGNNLYVPYHLIPPDNGLEANSAEPIVSTEIIERLYNERRILILGGPGTGKSALVRNLMHTYCQEPSLRSALRRYGFIPIWIRLRELARSPGLKITELARAALDEKEMTFDKEDSFFESLLRNSGFLIILDGLNEVSIEGSVDEFAITYPSVRLLTASQTDSISDSFRRYILPFFNAEFAKTLLRKFIGGEPAEEAINEASGLWGDIKCGYDVRLVEYIVRFTKTGARETSTPDEESTRLPTNRLELYEAMIGFSKRKYEQSAIELKAFPYARICERAWNMWRKGQYLFQPDESLPQTVIEHLVKTNLALKRPQGYEFMHSLMRDFLSAEFCIHHSGPTKLMIETRLKGEDADEIWKLPPSDQAPVLSFLTESMDKKEDLQETFQFASERIKERHQLMIAAQEAAKKKGWMIQMSIDVDL